MLFYVVYAKIIDDKKKGIYISGVLFGGVADNRDAADQIARDCVNGVRGHTIIPKIFKVDNPGSLMKTMMEAEKRFAVIEEEMQLSHVILERTSKMRRRH